MRTVSERLWGSQRWRFSWAWVVGVVLVALVLPGAKCSDSDKCKVAQAAAAVACAQDPASQSCKDATDAVVQACKPGTCPEACPRGTKCTDPKLGCQLIPPPSDKPVCQCDQGGPCCDCYHFPAEATDWQVATCGTGLQCNAARQCVATEPVCPEQCPVGTHCADPVKGCVPDVPTTCEPPCKANEKCVARGSVEKVYECVPVTPGPEAPLIADEDLTATSLQGPSLMWAETSAAIDRWRALHPEKWRGDGACLVSVSGIDEAFLGISTELLRVTIVAGQSITKDGKRSDCIFVNRTGTDLYEEMHLFDYGRACVATGPNAMRVIYRRTATTPPPPSVTCPYEPCPLKLWTKETLPPGWGDDAIGTAAWKWNAKLHTMGNADSTPVVVRQEPFCRAIGLSPYADGTPRASCPVRPDGHSERIPVENWLLDGGPVRDGRNGQDCTPNNTDNPFAFLAGTGNCRICNALQPPNQVCSEWF